LVVGDRDDVEYVISSLQNGAETAYRIIGATLLDRNATEVIIGDGVYPVVGNVHSVSATAAQLGADTIIVASRPEGEPDFVKRLSWQLEGTAAELVLSSRLTDI